MNVIILYLLLNIYRVHTYSIEGIANDQHLLLYLSGESERLPIKSDLPTASDYREPTTAVYCFEEGKFFRWEHTVTKATAMEIYFKNFTIGYYNNSHYTELAYSTNTSNYFVNPDVLKSTYYSGRITVSVKSLTDRDLFTLFLDKIRYTDAGIYGLTSNFYEPFLPPSYEIKQQVNVKQNCLECDLRCPKDSHCVQLPGDGEHCQCARYFYMDESQSICLQTNPRFYVTGLKLDYPWIKDLSSKYSSLYQGFAYHLETRLLAFLQTKPSNIVGIYVTNILQEEQKDLRSPPIIKTPSLSGFYVEFEIYTMLPDKALEPVIVKTWFDDAISDGILDNIRAEKLSKIVVHRSEEESLITDPSIKTFIERYRSACIISGVAFVVFIVSIVGGFMVRRRCKRKGQQYSVMNNDEEADGSTNPTAPIIAENSDISPQQPKRSQDPPAYVKKQKWNQEFDPTMRDIVAKEITSDMLSFVKHLGLTYTDLDNIKLDNPRASGIEICHKIYQKYEVENQTLTWKKIKSVLIKMKRFTTIKVVEGYIEKQYGA